MESEEELTHCRFIYTGHSKKVIVSDEFSIGWPDDTVIAGVYDIRYKLQMDPLTKDHQMQIQYFREWRYNKAKLQ